MFKGQIVIPKILASVPIDNAGNNVSRNVPLLGQIPPVEGLGILHVIGLLFRTRLNVTFTAGNPGVVGANNAIRSISHNNGSHDVAVGSFGFNALRMHEILQWGSPYLPDPDNTATATERYVDRVMFYGDPGQADFPYNGAVPANIWSQGTLNLTPGTLAEVLNGATGTAYSGFVDIYPLCVALFSEINVPQQFMYESRPLNAQRAEFQGRQLFTSLGIQAGTLWAPAALAAGNVGDISFPQLMTGGFQQAIPGNVYSAIAALSQLDGTNPATLAYGFGEPRSATDVTPKAPNPATPTAFAAAGREIQRIIALGKAKVSKNPYEGSNTFVAAWTGTLGAGTAGVVHAQYIRARENPEAYAAVGKKSAEALGRTLGDVRVKSAGGGVKLDNFRSNYLPMRFKLR